jgi:hypothetical protein
MRAAVYRFRSELRTRWVARAALAVTVGVVAAAVLVCAAGARRTGSAHDRFAERSNAYDIGVATTCGPNAATPNAATPTAAEPPAPQRTCHDELARLPSVADAATIGLVHAYVETRAGVSIQLDASDPCFSGPGEVSLLAALPGRFGRALNRRQFVAGRDVDPTRPDEVVISRATATRLGLHPGDGLRIRLFGVEGCEDDPARWSRPIDVRITGVQLSPGEIQPPSGAYSQFVEVTPAFLRAVKARPEPYLTVRLRPGATAAQFEREAKRAGFATDVVVEATANANAVENAIRPNAVSLALLAALTGLGAAAIFGTVLARHAVDEASDDGLLAALGMTRRQRIALGALRGGSIGAGAAVVAVVIAVAASPAMPIGVARQIEVHPGIAVDLVPLGIGAALLIAFTVVVTAFATVQLSGASADGGRVPRGFMTKTITRTRLSLTAMLGARFALRRGSGSAAVPVVSTFGGLVVAIAAIMGALTFSAGLVHLRETPALIGWNWDLIVALSEDVVDSETTAAEAHDRVRKASTDSDLIDAFTRGILWSPFPQGRDLQLGPERIQSAGFLAFDGGGPITPSIIAGRAPTTAREILLGTETLRALGLHIGDEVDAFGQDGTWEQPGAETSARMRIVGTGVIPVADQFGHGAAMTIDGAASLNSTVLGEAYFLRVAPGTDHDAVLAALRRAFPGAPDDAILAFGAGDAPDPLFKLEGIDSVPALFALLTTLMGAAVLAHVLLVGTRAHRRDLAVLRALGLSPGQTMRTVTWEAVLYVLVAAAVGTPLGIVAGRLAWRAYALGIDVVPEPVTPWAACAATATGALALAVLLALLPAWRAAHTRSAAVLRAD